MPVVHPGTGHVFYNEDKSPVTITLLGRSSEAFRDVLRQIQVNRADMANRRQTITDDDIYKEDTDTLLACTVNWTIKVLRGEAFPCNPQNARKLWTDMEFRWLRERALQFIIQDANFLPVSSKISSAPPAIVSDLPNHSPMAAE
jgi:hypothetical protein